MITKTELKTEYDNHDAHKGRLDIYEKEYYGEDSILISSTGHFGFISQIGPYTGKVSIVYGGVVVA